jgi:DNA-binding FadR family transcriptional regulator
MAVELEAVERRSLSDAVFAQLRQRILSGAFAVGAALPSERELCSTLGVNRGALREALKRLQQLRLVSIRQGESTRVLDYRRTGGLELLLAMVFDEAGSISVPVVRSFVEMRTALGPDIARLAAMRRTADQLAAIDELLEAMDACAADDAVELQRASLAFWRVLVEASENVAYQLAFNTMERAWSKVQDLVAPALLPEVGDRRGYRGIADAVRGARPGLAQRRAARLVQKGSGSMLALLDGWSAS